MEIIGKTKEITVTVTSDMLACNVGSGEVSVYATPMMIALMEQAAASCVKEALEEGQTTVGTSMNTTHVAATPCGMKVTASAQVLSWEGRSITFHVKAYDEELKEAGVETNEVSPMLLPHYARHERKITGEVVSA